MGRAELIEIGAISRNRRFVFVRNGDCYFINNDRGKLIIGRFTPGGFQEIRTTLIEPTSDAGRHRDLGAVNWSHPACANRHVIARNDREVVRISLAKN